MTDDQIADQIAKCLNDETTKTIKRFFYEFRRKQVIAARKERDRLEAWVRGEQPPPAPFQPLDQQSLNSLYMPWTMACWAKQSDDPDAPEGAP